MPQSSAEAILPFAELIEDLRRQGFVISVDRHIRLQRLLLQLEAGIDPAALRDILCPIFATSAEQQAIFRQTFERYRHILAGTTAPFAPVEPSHERKSGLWIRLVPAVVLSLLALAGLLRLAEFAQPDGSAPAVTVQSGGTPQPDANQPQNRTQQPDGGSATPVASPAAAAHSTNSLTPPARTFSGRIVASIVFILFYLLIETIHYRRRRLVLRRERHSQGPWSWAVQPQTAPAPLFESGQFFTVAKRLRQRESGEILQLDVPGTVAATARAAGLVRFQYRLITRSPEYLVLIDRAGSGDHLARYFVNLVGALRTEALYLRAYYYDGDLRACLSEDHGGIVHLGELAGKFADHRLIVLGSGHRALDPVTGRLEGWTHLLSRWQFRALMTPMPTNDWGDRERNLADIFDVWPASTEALSNLAEAWESPGFAARGANRSPVRPGKTAEGGPIQDGRGDSDLDGATRRWLCACAVYPDLQWDLTLRLGSLSIIGALTPGSVGEARLLALFRLPWFRQGWIPDRDREFLIEQLGGDAEIEVRTEILAALKNSPVPEKGYAREERDWQIVSQQFWLNSGEPQARQAAREALRHEPRRALRGGATTLRVIESLSTSRLLLALPQAFRTIFFPNGLPIFGVRPVVRLVLLFAAVALLWLAGNIPGFNQFKARDELNQGVKAFKQAQYSEAASHFQAAVDLDPTFGAARLYLATAYMSEYIPGVESPDNKRDADNAIQEFQAALASNLDNANKLIAMQWLASIYYNLKDYSNAVEWDRRVIAADPRNKDAYYALGVIAWSQFVPSYQEAIQAQGLNSDAPGPLRSPLKDELKAKYLQTLSEGIEDLKKALELDPEYADAIAYMKLLVRYRASLDDTRYQYDADIKEGDAWVEKTMETKKKRAERTAPSSGK